MSGQYEQREAGATHCGACKMPWRADGVDPCMGRLPGVVNACCGHGEPAQAYIEFENGVSVAGIVQINHPRALYQEPLSGRWLLPDVLNLGVASFGCIMPADPRAALTRKYLARERMAAEGED